MFGIFMLESLLHFVGAKVHKKIDLGGNRVNILSKSLRAQPVHTACRASAHIETRRVLAGNAPA